MDDQVFGQLGKHCLISMQGEVQLFILDCVARKHPLAQQHSWSLGNHWGLLQFEVGKELQNVLLDPSFRPNI